MVAPLYPTKPYCGPSGLTGSYIQNPNRPLLIL
uniref:Uncharacterized protein n=1 Tax=Arundo donax TaxID=35708 RepID=A0A0A9GLA5_ARUDO